MGIGFRWGPPCAMRSRCLPRSFAADRSFSTVVEASVKEAEVRFEPIAFARLECVAACVACAARRIAQADRAPLVACDAEWQAQWLAVARPASLRRSRRRFEAVLARNSAHAHLFDVGRMMVDSKPNLP